MNNQFKIHIIETRNGGCAIRVKEIFSFFLFYHIRGSYNFLFTVSYSSSRKHEIIGFSQLGIY
jgi:hypothetical protein